MSETLIRNIWSLCHILRGDGITYYQYFSELSYLLFLKIAQENETESLIPPGCRWGDLENHDLHGLLGFYQEMLLTSERLPKMMSYVLSMLSPLPCFLTPKISRRSLMGFQH